MNTDEPSSELVATQLLLAKFLVRTECDALSPRPLTIAKAWRRASRRYSAKEWYVGANALMTHLQAKQSPLNQEAIQLLSEGKISPDSNNSKITSAADIHFSDAVTIRTQTCHDELQLIDCDESHSTSAPNLHGATRGTYRRLVNLMSRAIQSGRSVLHG